MILTQSDFSITEYFNVSAFDSVKLGKLLKIVVKVGFEKPRSVQEGKAPSKEMP